MSRAKKNLEEFIVLFRDLPCLWQTKSKDYHDRTKKAAAYEKLVDKLKEVEPQANKDCVLKKINNLRSSYRKEMKKIKESTKSGSGTDEVYQPKLWYFDSLSFLNDQETPRQSCSNIDENDNEEDTEVTPDNSERSHDDFNADEVPSFEDHESSLPTPTPRPRPTPKKMTSSQQAELTGEVLQSLKEHFKRPRITEDRYDTFGKYVANVLRDVVAQQRILAEKFINDILFQAQMGALTSSNVLAEVPQKPLLQQYTGPPTAQNANYASNSNAVPWLQSGNAFYNTIPTTMSLQEGKQTNNTHDNHPSELSPYNSTESITVSHFVSTFRPEDGQ